MNFLKIVNIVWHNSPEFLYTRLKFKIKTKENYDYSINTILKDKKYLNVTNLIDRWERYKRVLGEKIKTQENSYLDLTEKAFSFEGKTIFEIGCGPFLGWGPISLFLGSRIFYYYDPAIISSVIESEKVKNQYFLPLFKELTLNYGERMNYEEFLLKISSSCIPLNVSEKINKKINLVLSNSVLEHMPKEDLISLLKFVYLISTKEMKFFHAVDFKEHGHYDEGIFKIYKNKKPNKIKNGINYLRKSEINNILKELGFNCVDIVYRSQKFLKKELHSDWKYYELDDLESCTVFFCGNKYPK
jgi:hypothetical protein